MNAVLELMHFSTTGDVPGLLAVNEDSVTDRVEEQYALRQARSIGSIDYVFFRRFSDGRSSQAAACVIDNSDDHLDANALAIIHQKLWLNGFSPLLYVGWQTRVDVLSCARGPDFWRDSKVHYEPAETIHITRQISASLDAKVQRFSANRLSDGTFWDEPQNAVLARAEKAAHQQLIRAVVQTDLDIEGGTQPILRRLLLLTVLIKYLEDRGVFPDQWFAQFLPGATSFFDLLKKASPDTIRELLAHLERKFNGDVFDLPEEVKHLNEKQLRQFADLVEAKTLGAQRYLWEQFSFRYIPVEVLSHLYQHFATAGNGAVFTPPMVASLMLDYAMPYENMTGDERILDPTCGSGIFLVGAFRRLVHFWQSKRAWEQPTVAVLKKILKHSIFGVELQGEALHLAAFSLALAVCDALQPNVIWSELRFDKLVGSNLWVSDFSEWLKRLPSASDIPSFSVIVGNPPFMSKLNQAAMAYRKGQHRQVKIPDGQLAYFILEQCADLLSDKGRLCLIQPNGFLYNAKARGFQLSFFAGHCVTAVLDFTSIRKLYDGADPKTIAVLCTRSKRVQSSDLILHLTFRRTVSVSERIAFELDHYDRHLLTQEEVKCHAWMWRINLLGGGRLKGLAARIDRQPKLRAFLRDKGWDYGEGFVGANSGKVQTASWLTGQPFLPTDAFDEQGIDQSRISIVHEKVFRSAYTKDRYSAPLVLIKEVDTLPAVFWDKGFIGYRHQIVGIHAPTMEEVELKQFYEQFVEHREVLRAFCAMFGTRALSGKATSILKRDLDVLPWPNLTRDWDLSWWEELLCNDVVEFAGDFIRLGQNSRLLLEQVETSSLERYCDIFIRMLGSIYANLRRSHSGLIDGLAFQAFCFGDTSSLEWPGDWVDTVKKVIYKQHGDALRTVRILRFYERNTIVLIKPDRLRYWIPSTAIRDADETLTDLQRQGH